MHKYGQFVPFDIFDTLHVESLADKELSNLGGKTHLAEIQRHLRMSSTWKGHDLSRIVLFCLQLRALSRYIGTT